MLLKNFLSLLREQYKNKLVKPFRVRRLNNDDYRDKVSENVIRLKMDETQTLRNNYTKPGTNQKFRAKIIRRKAGGAECTETLYVSQIYQEIRQKPDNNKNNKDPFRRTTKI